MGLKPILFLRNIILLTTKKPTKGPFLRRHWLRGVVRPTPTLARDYTAIIGPCAITPGAFKYPSKPRLAYNSRPDSTSFGDKTRTGMTWRITNLKRLLTLLLMVSLAGLLAYGFVGNVPPKVPAESDFRMPTGKPLLEPNRPDLIGDPGIEPGDKDENDCHGTRH